MTGGERYEFGEFTLDATERRLSRSGQAVPLEPRALDVLVALRRAGRLLTRRKLLELVWPESFVEEGILAVHISTLRKALGDRGDGPRWIETVTRSGYRFIGAVTQGEVVAQGWSIAVLPARPFTAAILSGRDRATGLTLADALIDRLGRFRQIIVRPARAVHGYTKPKENPAAIGRSLRVDDVLAVTFLRTADQVRVSARLIRSQDGADLWSGQFDDPASDIMAIADAIAGSVAAYIGLKDGGLKDGGLKDGGLKDGGLKEGGLNGRSKRPPIPAEVHELVGRGRSHLLHASMFEVPKAIEAFRAAIELAPAYAGAHAGLALAQWRSAFSAYRVSRKRFLRCNWP